MKVLHVIPSVSAVHGGPSRAIIDIERALTKRGIDVTTATTNDDGDARTLPVQCGKPIATDSATRWYFPRTTVFFKTSLGLARWLRETISQFDLVHVHALFSFAPVVAALIARQAGVPFVVRPLGVLARYGMTRHHPVLKRISFSLIERRVIESASAVHFTSLAEQAEADMLGLKYKGAMIPLGIDLGNWRQIVRTCDNKDNFELLFLSRVDPKKNLEGLLTAMPRVLAYKPNVTLNIAGDGDQKYIAGLKLLARKLKIEGQVKWLGHLEGEKKSEAFAAASAFVLPSYSENFGIVVAEAMAAGLPCIVSRAVALSAEVVQAGAGVAVGTKPEEIAEGIEHLSSDGPGLIAKSSAARALAVSTFSSDTMGARLEALYRDILMRERSVEVALAS